MTECQLVESYEYDLLHVDIIVQAACQHGRVIHLTGLLRVMENPENFLFQGWKTHGILEKCQNLWKTHGKNICH